MGIAYECDKCGEAVMATYADNYRHVCRGRWVKKLEEIEDKKIMAEIAALARQRKSRP